MKNKLFAFAILLVLSTAIVASAYAFAPIKIVFDEDELNSDVAPIIENGRVLVPLRVIAEKFGAEVVWDAKSNTVRILTAKTPDKIQVPHSWVTGLEEAVAAKDAVTAAETWAQGVKTRNGALQYAVMTPELQKEWYQKFAESNWSTGTSSPWVEKYEVIEKSIINNEAIKYEVVFTYTDSTQSTFSMREYVTVKKQDANWHVSSLKKVDVSGKVTKLILNDDQDITGVFVEGEQQKGISYDKANVMITDDTKIYRGDTDEIISKDNLKEGITVEAFFGGPVLMIYPVQGGAEIIRVFE
ncbi:MAG TPA: hypothetical protein DEF34_06815 [Desulfotomaculum sp.]|nr:hypothetical protein [Desulfotomaculum sp.]